MSTAQQAGSQPDEIQTSELREFARRSQALAFRILGHRADAQDVAQEVMFRLLKHARRLDKGRNVPAWIHRVTVNCCNDILRHRRRQSTLDVEALQAPPVSTDVHDLPSLLGVLSPRERTAVALVFGQGLTCREAALAMICLPATVRVLCHRARRKMRPLMETPTR